MQCAIMQPTYLPWLGYFDMIRQVDVFVVYDTVQFEKQSWQQRNKIRNKSGELMLTVPVLHGEGLNKKIKDVKIDYKRNSVKKHFQSIQQSYSKATNYQNIIHKIEKIYTSSPACLIEMNMQFIELGINEFEIQTPLVFASSLSPQGNRVEALIDICQKLNADHYLSPIGSKPYIDENNLFDKFNIQLNYQQFQHPVYPQINYSNFISHLCFLDYLFNSNDKNFSCHESNKN